MVSLEPWKEGTLIVNALDKGMVRVAISTHRSNYNTAMVVFYCFWLANADRTSFDRLVVDSCGVVDCKCDVPNSITVIVDVIVHLDVILVEWRLKSVDNLTVAYNVSASRSVAGLKSLE